MANPRATATLVAGGIMRVMGAIFEGSSATGEAVTVLPAGGSRFRNMQFTLDANDSPMSQEAAKPPHLEPVTIEGQTVAVFDVSGSPFGRLIKWQRRAPIESFQLFVNGRSIMFDRNDHAY